MVTVWVISGAFLVLRGAPGIVALWRSRLWTETDGKEIGIHGRNGYSYRIDGNEHIGYRRTFDPGAGTHPPTSEREKSDLGAGRALWVWYDPQDPRRSVARRSASTSLLLVALGLTSLILAAHTLISGVSR